MPYCTSGSENGHSICKNSTCSTVFLGSQYVLMGKAPNPRPWALLSRAGTSAGLTGGCYCTSRAAEHFCIFCSMVVRSWGLTFCYYYFLNSWISPLKMFWCMAVTESSSKRCSNANKGTTTGHGAFPSNVSTSLGSAKRSYPTITIKYVCIFQMPLSGLIKEQLFCLVLSLLWLWPQKNPRSMLSFRP